MATVRTCDICGFIRGRGEVKRYGLSRQIQERKGSGHRHWSAGGLDICDQCWEVKAKPKMRPHRIRPDWC